MASSSKKENRGTLTDVPANLDELVHVHLHNVIPLVLFQMGAVIHWPQLD